MTHPNGRRTAFCILALALGLAASGARAVPLMQNVEGKYSDNFGDGTGLSFSQNVRVGPDLIHGIRVSLTKWSWAQSYSSSSDTVHTPFSDRNAVFSLSQVKRTCGTCWDSEEVIPWQETYYPELPTVGGMLRVASFASTTTYDYTRTPGQYAYIPDPENFRGQYLIRGPYTNNLVVGEDYTVTFKAFYQDDPIANGTTQALGAEVAQLELYHGGSMPVAGGSMKLGQYNFGGDFIAEGALSPYTLETDKIPMILPPWQGWDYRMMLTITTTGAPATPPCGSSWSCTASLWVSSVTAMIKGRIIKERAYRTPPGLVAPGVDCPAGTVPCGPDCITPGLQCGWDAATYYVSSCSYLSPVFDSLSAKTVWASVWWRVRQNFSGVDEDLPAGYPRTPVTIKWRVGDGPDPALWLGRSEWFTWTIPFTVTCYGETYNCDSAYANACAAAACDCTSQKRIFILGVPQSPCNLAPFMPYLFQTVYPPPMENCGTYPMFAKGDPAIPLQGRYFQYSVDFTGQFANERYTPEREQYPYKRQTRDALSARLRNFRVYYKPSRGMAVSNTIAPTQLKKWGKITYTTDMATGGRVQVDVLDEHNIPLFTDVPSGFSLDALDPGRYPAIRLRAFVDNGGVITVVPMLTSWQVTWDTIAEALQLDRNKISLRDGESLGISVIITAARSGSLTVHDAAGQLVRTFQRGAFAPGIASYTWDGRNEQGKQVAAGVYFVALRAKEIRSIKKVAVVR